MKANTVPIGAKKNENPKRIDWAKHLDTNQGHNLPMVKIRNVLSLFDGISCGYLALKKAGIEFENYYASEIDPKCVELAEKHHNIISLGDVSNWQDWDLENIQLVGKRSRQN